MAAVQAGAEWVPCSTVEYSALQAGAEWVPCAARRRRAAAVQLHVLGLRRSRSRRAHLSHPTVDAPVLCILRQ